MGKVWASLVLLVGGLVPGCVALEFLVGKTESAVIKEADADGNGVVSKEEWKATAWDADQDGIIDPDEMKAATSPSDIPDNAAKIAAGAGVPFVGTLLVVLGVLRKYKKALWGVVAGVDQYQHEIAGSETAKAKLHAALQVGAERWTSLKSLAKLVGSIKDAIRK